MISMAQISGIYVQKLLNSWNIAIRILFDLTAKLKSKISKVYDISLQRYRDEKIRDCCIYINLRNDCWSK